ncbi:MAG TPA: S8 family serine peptidase [Actinomycetota bacterium]|nr:S8 family serine peptidase [Actinomycetota bacterium]
MTPRRADTNWYVDKTSGRRVTFTPKPDEVIVRFDPAEDRPAALVQAEPVKEVSQGIDARRGFAAVYVREGRTLDDLEAATDITKALPVMVDEEGLERYFLPDELTVQFRRGVDEATAERIIAEEGSRIVVRQRTPGYYTVSVPEGRGLFDAIRSFAERDEVMFAEPSEAGFNDALDHFPDDDDFNLLWGLHNTGQTVNGTSGVSGVDIDAPAAWDLTRGDPRVVVAVIDTGADLDHPDLEDNLLPRGSEDWDFADSGDPVPEDGGSHGTHVAGTAVAVENSFGVVGVAPRCRLMPLRINLQAGVNQNRADAINYVADRAVADGWSRFVVNCSWRANGDHAGIRTAIQNAVASNVVVVFAAGNADTDTDETPQYPGVYPEVISVAAIDQRGVRAVYELGASNYGSTVDVSAPGADVYSSIPGGGHAYNGGTSMASPHVAGVAALVWSAAPGLTNQQVREVIEATCDDVDADNPDYAGQLGRGRVNAHAAVELAQFMAHFVPAAAALA